jgi:hypothetical protein
MRRLIAFLLLAVLGSAISAPLFAYSSAKANDLPACCRKNGKHHCMMTAAGGLSSQASVSAVPEKCPCFPKDSSPAVDTVSLLPNSTAFYAGALSHPACFAQVEAHYRISFDRSRQKRGPPVDRL